MARCAQVVLCIIALMFVAGQALPPDKVIAQRGSVTLTASQVQRLIASQDSAVQKRLKSDPAALAQAVRTQLLQMVLLDEARGKKFDQDPDVAFRADQARDASIVNQYMASLTTPPADYPSDAEVQAAYDANKEKFVLPRQFHLAQIFVAVPANADAAAVAAAERKAKDIHQQLTRRKGDFKAIATRQSDDHASAGNGGDVGWTREDQLPPPIKEAAGALQENAISDPIRVPDGWHIIKLLGVKPSGIASLADVRDSLIRAMRQQRASQSERAYVQGLVQKEPIQLDEIALPQALH